MKSNLNEMNEVEEPRRVAAYLRVNAVGAVGGTQLVEQQNAVQRFADENGLEVCRWYVETASGSAGAEHPALDRLLADVASDARDFDCLVVWSLSRLSRSLARLAAVCRELADCGVALVSVSEAPAGHRFDRVVQDLLMGPGEIYVEGRRI